MDFLDGFTFLDEKPRDQKPPDATPRKRFLKEWERDAVALIDEILVLHPALVASRDDILRDLDLTSAKCRLLKTVIRSPVSLTVSDCARRMGLARQSVQRLADDLARQQFLRYEEGYDRRASILTVTTSGRKACAAANPHTFDWLFLIARGIDEKTLRHIRGVLRTIRRRLASRNEPYRNFAGYRDE